MIVGDQKIATLVAQSAFVLSLACLCSGAASAVEPSPVTAAAADAEQTSVMPVTVTVVENGVEVRISTLARTVGALLEERDDRPVTGDFLTPAASESLVDGMRITFRQAKPVEIKIGRTSQTVRSAAATVGELLATQHIDVAPGDDVEPARDAPLAAPAIVRIVKVSRWTAHVHRSIAQSTERRADAQLPYGASRVLDSGSPGMLEATLRFVKRGDAVPSSTVVATHVLRAPRVKIVARGVGAYQSLAHVAEQGFASAVHFAGSALHMIATAYSAGCYGCSGFTASGLRAGFGIIAVDPSIIPLGTKLFIPGYGRAVAGDTGGAIRGHRIDLGFNNDGQALQWGNRRVTVYLLR